MKEDKEYKAALKEFLASTRLERRQDTLLNVLNNRTRYMTVVLENIYQSHNASAVLRSCDCFGIQDVHIIENSYTYEVNPQIAVRSTQWLTLNRYNQEENNTKECLQHLKKQGYRIVSTSPCKESKSIYDFDIHAGKFALLFGTEREGLTDIALQMADESVHIPMFGFTESFNISVSVALCLFYYAKKLRDENLPWQLLVDEKLDIELQWYRNTIKNSQFLEKKFEDEYDKAKEK